MMDNSEVTLLSCRDFFLPRSLWPRRSPNPSLLYLERMRGERRKERFTRHDFAEMTIVAGGAGTLETPEESFDLSEGDAVLVPAQVPHRESGAKSFDTVWIGFSLEDPAAIPERPTVVRDEELLRLAVDAWRGVRMAKPLSGPEFDGMLLTILGRFLRLRNTAGSEGGALRWERLFEHLHDRFASPLQMPELAARVGCSESAFFRRFRKLAGCTPVQYLTRLRLNQAKVYLANTDFTLATIAGLCGFRDPYYLSKTFRKNLGFSPDTFRRALRKNGQ